MKLVFYALQMTVCQTCGDKGDKQLLICCNNYQEPAVHRYAVSSDEYFSNPAGCFRIVREKNESNLGPLVKQSVLSCLQCLLKKLYPNKMCCQRVSSSLPTDASIALYFVPENERILLEILLMGVFWQKPSFPNNTSFATSGSNESVTPSKLTNHQSGRFYMNDSAVKHDQTPHSLDWYSPLCSNCSHVSNIQSSAFLAKSENSSQVSQMPSSNVRKAKKTAQMFVLG
ncbi:hypothetical protein ACH5RR_012670 [Cinchona calisaya]|uniref:Uncharacterized protein n=1 Tax=Cinchona calisaya TaxID=153742 RepID=A0ABD3A8F4_9GENT